MVEKAGCSECREVPDPPTRNKRSPQKRNCAAPNRSRKQRNLKSYKPPKRFVRWQLGLATHKLPICIPTRHRRSMLPGRHAICFHLSHIPCETCDSLSRISYSLRNTVPLGCFFGGCPPPPVTFPATRLNFRRATSLPFGGSFPKGATCFYPGARKNLSILPSKPFGLSDGRQTTANRSAAVLSRSLTTPFADPFAGLKDRNLRDGESYTEKNSSRQSFVCFIFILFFWRVENICSSRVLIEQLVTAFPVLQYAATRASLETNVRRCLSTTSNAFGIVKKGLLKGEFK